MNKSETKRRTEASLSTLPYKNIGELARVLAQNRVTRVAITSITGLSKEEQIAYRKEGTKNRNQAMEKDFLKGMRVKDIATKYNLGEDYTRRILLQFPSCREDNDGQRQKLKGVNRVSRTEYASGITNRNEKIISDFLEGKTKKQLAREWNLSQWRIIQITAHVKSCRKKSQYLINRSLANEGRNNNICTDYNNGTSVRNLALAYNLSETTIRYILKNAVSYSNENRN